MGVVSGCGYLVDHHEHDSFRHMIFDSFNNNINIRFNKVSNGFNLTL